MNFIAQTCVCFVQYSIKDRGIRLDNGNILRVLDAGRQIFHVIGMTTYDDLQRCLDFFTDNRAKALNLDNRALSFPANLMILNAKK
ncbi:MAG: hypothetical protein ACSLEL_04625 [Candidatus Malihini olakiniferum]